MIWTPHSDKQEQAVFSDRKITLCGTGIQWGKTRVGAVRTKLKMHTYTAEDDAFIIAAPSYKIMEQSTLPAFKAIMAGLGNYNAQRAEFRMHGGGICYFRTSTDPDSIVGITNVRHIWGDEAGKYPLYFWENLQGRASFKDCQIDLTTSPYSLNWIFKEIIRPKLRDPKARPDALWVHARSDENPYFPIEEYNRRKATMDPRRFAAMYGGQWERMAGLVYDCFDEAENQCEAFALPQGTRFFGGIDWGHTEPFVLAIRAVTPEGNHYGVSEFYKSGLTISDIVGIVKAKHQVFDLSAVYCGPDQPAHIMELNRAGIVALPADNNVRLGIDRHYELLKTRRLKYFRNLNPYTMDEIDTYHYPDPDSLGPDDNVKENKPVQQHDHALDANRYVSIMTYSNTAKLVPRVASDNTIRLDHWAETEKLKKKPRMNTQTEKWG